MTAPSRPHSLPPRALETLREHGVELRGVAPLAGDVSLRRYFRVGLGADRTAILATYPREIAATCGRFVRSTEILATSGIRTPEILLPLCDDGLMLLEDLGERTLFDLRNQPWDVLTAYLKHAAELISAIASIPPESVRGLNPPLDQELLAAELTRTWALLLGDGGVLPGSLPSALDRALEEMVARLSTSEQLPCHRDFMARNLVPLPEAPALAVIDHQDLRMGPKAYDVAALLNDSLYPPPDVEIRISASLLGSSGEILDYHRAASQRTLKAVGTFVAFARRGDSRHTGLIRPTLECARRHLLELPEMAALGSAIDTLWSELIAALPAAEVAG